ncbi:MAG: patatin-like phospholipase family protein [Hyphomicrobium sp.]|nr:patatin-like phospholipase family protein [Hyphomicrobium sp.]
MQRTKPVNLALQGGGAHGAFAWGVLDRLIEDGRLDITAISATSAGAMNAVVMAYGVSVGGMDGARAKLDEFWREISRVGELYSPVRTLPWEKWLQAYGFRSEFSPTFMAFQAMTHLFSPYQLNPFDFNPLKDVLSSVVDFEKLSRCNRATRLFLSATNVRTGKIRVFDNHEVSVDVVLASACLPYVFKAVEIDGEAYWDGGFMGNPAIFPLIYNGRSNDVIIVHINPIERKKLPRTAPEIFDRINEISFNSSLMREMRTIEFVTKLIDDGLLDSNRYHRMRIHSIRDDAEMTQLGVATKLNPDWEFLCRLRDVGRARAGEWLERNYDRIGSESSVDLSDVFL